MQAAAPENTKREVSPKARASRELLLYFVLIACCAFASTFASQLLLGKAWSESARWLTKCLLVMLSVCALTSHFLRRQGEKWNQFGVEWSSRAATNTAVGVICGVVTAAAWAAVVWLHAPFHLERNPGASFMQIVSGIIATFAIGIGEEVGYRTYGMKLAGRAAGLAGALLIPTSIFLLMHLAGGMPWPAALLVVGSSSLLYGVLMLVTRSLPLVAAFHIGNNLVQDAILRPSANSLWQVHFHSIDSARHASMRIWLGIAIVNLSILAVIAWRSRVSSKNLPT
jgi:membrane protease YdiL (CAAX protease family)